MLCKFQYWQMFVRNQKTQKNLSTHKLTISVIHQRSRHLIHRPNYKFSCSVFSLFNSYEMKKNLFYNWLFIFVLIFIFAIFLNLIYTIFICWFSNIVTENIFIIIINKIWENILIQSVQFNKLMELIILCRHSRFKEIFEESYG